MSDAISAVVGVDAVSLTVAASMSARQSIERREKRLRWLASLRAAQGEPDPEAEARRDAALLEDNRERIAAALGTIEEFGKLGAGTDDLADAPSRGTITAADLARHMAARSDIALRVQAHLGAASVRRLVGGDDAGENPTDAVNEL